jgi:hypothetical protein
MSEGESGGIRPGMFSDDAWTTACQMLRIYRMVNDYAVNAGSALHPSLTMFGEGPGIDYRRKNAST